MQNIKEHLKSAVTKNGAYSTVLIAIMVGIVIVVNLIAGQLPESIRSIDLSDNNIYEITETTKELIKNLDKKVKVSVIAEQDKTDQKIKTFLEKYADLSNKISVEWIDPVLHPTALKEYNTEADTIVVACEDTDKSVTIPFTDITVYDMSGYYTGGSAQEMEFDGEGQLTSAVNTVTSDAAKTIYLTAGHGEGAFPDSVSGLMQKADMKTSELNLMMDTAIPEDCDLLFLNAPVTDFAEAEITAVTDYMAKGGKVFYLLGDAQKELPALDAFLQEYGLVKENGYIADMERCLQGNYYNIFPEITATGELTKGLESKMVLLVNALGLTETDPVRDTITLQKFMTTSQNGYAVTEDNQKQGTYILGAVATETLSETEESEKSKASMLTVISANSIIDSSITSSFSSVENLDLFMNAIANNFDDVSNIAITPKSMQVTYNTPQHAGLFSLFLIFGIPAVTLIGGLAVWTKRRKA